MALIRTVERTTLRWFAKFERPAAWTLCVGAVITFVGVIVGIIVVGDAKWATLLVSADLAISGFSALRDAYDEEPETG